MILLHIKSTEREKNNEEQLNKLRSVVLHYPYTFLIKFSAVLQLFSIILFLHLANFFFPIMNYITKFRYNVNAKN